MRSAAGLGARAGCGKPVAAMACGRWLWKALATGAMLPVQGSCHPRVLTTAWHEGVRDLDNGDVGNGVQWLLEAIREDIPGDGNACDFA